MKYKTKIWPVRKLFSIKRHAKSFSLDRSNQDIAGTALRRVTSFLQWLWNIELRFGRSGFQLAILALLSAIALSIELAIHQNALKLRSLFEQVDLNIFYNVQSITVFDIDSSLARVLLVVIAVRILCGVVVALADLAMYERITGRPFDWEGMINSAVVNTVFLTTSIYGFANEYFESILKLYTDALDSVPTIMHVHGSLAILIACLLGDGCFYWSHRWAHNIRIIFMIGHIHHHRTRELSQLTHMVDPQSLPLDVAGGKAFVLLLLPFALKLFSLDIRDAGWMIVAVAVADTLLNNSHSVALYSLESCYPKIFRLIRVIFVTPAVHYVHHSSHPEHDRANGCNFAARFTVWDRIMGTYIDPPLQIPRTGLFNESDYCRNPIRFILQPWIKIISELNNNPRNWFGILFR